MSDFQALRETFKGDLITPADPEYDVAIRRWARNAERRAALVAFVKDADDVSTVLKYVKTHKLPFAVRGGGHSSSGASSSENGVVIDLSRYLNTVTVDSAKKQAKIGGGALWATVDKTCIEHGLVTVGGTVNDTGVGGLILGGGYGWLSGTQGMVVDNLKQATVVIADGSILVASETENPDLFWAIRGGGGNFGVAVEFVLQLHDQRKTIYSGMWVFPGPQLEAVVKTTEEWYRNVSPKEGMIQIFTRGPDGNPCIVVYPFYNGTEAEGREKFKAFYDLGPVVDQVGDMPFDMLNDLQKSVAAPGKNAYLKGVYQAHPRFDVSKHLFDCMVERSARPDHAVAVLCEFFPLEKIRSVPVEATAFPNRGQQCNVLVITLWENGDVDVKTQEGRDTAKAVTEIITRTENNPLAGMNTGYANYDGEEKVSPDRAKVLFGSNYPRLQEIKKKYDPEMMFCKWFVIEPAK